MRQSWINAPYKRWWSKPDLSPQSEIPVGGQERSEFTPSSPGKSHLSESGRDPPPAAPDSCSNVFYKDQRRLHFLWVPRKSFFWWCISKTIYETCHSLERECWLKCDWLKETKSVHRWLCQTESDWVYLQQASVDWHPSYRLWGASPCLIDTATSLPASGQPNDHELMAFRRGQLKWEAPNYLCPFWSDIYCAVVSTYRQEDAGRETHLYINSKSLEVIFRKKRTHYLF